MNEKEILKELRNNLDASENQSLELLDGLYEAEKRNNRPSNPYFSPFNKEFKENLNSAHKALKELNKFLRNLDREHQIILDEHYRTVGDSYDISDISKAIMQEQGYREPVLCSIMACAEKALKSNCDAVEKLSIGGNNNRGKKYIAAIETLAHRYMNTFPDRKITKSKGTPFYRYAYIWFFYFVFFTKNNDVDETKDKDITRQMNQAFQHPLIRVPYDKNKK
jgi:hypothetical protein